MRCITKTTALALLPLVLGIHARTAENEPKEFTLSCDGTLTRTSDATKPMDMEVLQKISVVVNLNDQTVFFLGYVTPSPMSIRSASTSAEGRSSTTDSASASGAILIGQVVA
jgi:hypothetical protein